MSRIGKKPIEIPADVEVQIAGQQITFKGPKGTLSYIVSGDFQIAKEGANLSLAPRSDAVKSNTSALWGTQRQILANMAKGVKEGFVKRLEIEGVGYRANVQGQTVLLQIGFTNPVSFVIPEGIQVEVEKNVMKISGADKSQVSQLAARMRMVRPAEPYKGKGIRYEGEVVRRKLGKKAATAGAAPTAAK